MNLKRALELQVEYNSKVSSIHIDKNNYFCLNDMNMFFPHKELRNYLDNFQTKEFLFIVLNDLHPELAEMLNPSDPRGLKTSDFSPIIITKRGRYGGGTYAHRYIAMEFAMWLSPEFKLEVIKAYETGIDRKESWDFQREMAARGYKFLVESVKEKLIPLYESEGRNPYYAITEEADLINMVVFGKRACEFGGNQRNYTDETTLEIVEYLQRMDSGFIEAGLDYKERYDKLTELYHRKHSQLELRRISLLAA